MYRSVGIIEVWSDESYNENLGEKSVNKVEGRNRGSIGKSVWV